ncbi:MAG TPA: hypothetical protein VGH65_01610 [Verrucomicrobiaceae bacterium]
MCFIVFLTAPVLRAHTVPTITVEAEFNAKREVTLRVNLDPRLFLSAQPTSLPPLPASWWFDQNEEARAASLAAARDYVVKTVRFEAGDVRIEGQWKVSPIDSASAFPLGQSSAEVHLLLEHRDVLPEAAGDFKVTLDPKASVGLILLNSLEGKTERHPQAIFPGETSRGFKLPERSESPAAPAAGGSGSSVPAGIWDGIVAVFRKGLRHFAGDHWLVALALAAVLGGRLLHGIVMLALFFVTHVLAAFAVAGGWLPEAPVWMQIAGWIAVGAGIFLVHRREWLRAGVCFAVAGLCHGLNLPHLHLAEPNRASILRDAALMGGSQVLLLILAKWFAMIAWRRRRKNTAGMAAC